MAQEININYPPMLMLLMVSMFLSHDNVNAFADLLGFFHLVFERVVLLI